MRVMGPPSAWLSRVCPRSIISARGATRMPALHPGRRRREDRGRRNRGGSCASDRPPPPPRRLRDESGPKRLDRRLHGAGRGACARGLADRRPERLTDDTGARRRGRAKSRSPTRQRPHDFEKRGVFAACEAARVGWAASRHVRGLKLRSCAGCSGRCSPWSRLSRGSLRSSTSSVGATSFRANSS